MKATKKILIPFLTLIMSGFAVCPPMLAESVYRQGAMIDRTIELNETTNVPGGSKRTSLAVNGQNVRDVLRGLALQAGFNLVMDNSVQGNVSIESSNITINQALQSISTMADLMIVKQPGDIYLVIAREEASKRGLNRQLSKVVKLTHVNAARVADTLNKSIFDPSVTTEENEKAKADLRSNSVILVGTVSQISAAEETVSRMDRPRETRTFYLSHANAFDVAQILKGSLYNDPSPSDSKQKYDPSSMNVDEQTIEDGKGVNEFGDASSGQIDSGLSQDVTIRRFKKETKSNGYSVKPEGAIVVPDTRQNAVTIVGTAEQIAMAEALIPTLDAQLPQVAIEVSLIEINSTGRKELGSRVGISDGRTQYGFNNIGLEGVPNNDNLPAALQTDGGLIGMPTVDSDDPVNFARSGLVYSTNPLAQPKDYVFQIRNLITQNKAKILANPTIVATHDTESIISIVDQIVHSIRTQVTENTITTIPEIDDAGIVLDILPKIGDDGTVNMRIRPSVTSVIREFRIMGNLVTLLNKRDLYAQNVRIKDGESLVIGGLIEERENSMRDIVPGLGNLPIVGAMFRASQRDTERTELVLLITPHILNKTRPTPVHAVSSKPINENYGAAGGYR